MNELTPLGEVDFLSPYINKLNALAYSNVATLMDVCVRDDVAVVLRRYLGLSQVAFDEVVGALSALCSEHFLKACHEPIPEYELGSLIDNHV